MHDDRKIPDWLDAQQPHEPERSAGQIEGVLQLLDSPPQRVLDLGCGAGRVLVPLAEAGHAVVGVDCDPGVLDRCRRACDAAGVAAAALLHADFASDDWPAGDPFNAVCLLGNTLMTLHDVDEAVEVLSRAGRALAPDGQLLIDDTPFDFWPELTSGNWQQGVSEDLSMQMVWASGDAVFSLRHGDEVDESDWSPRPHDRTFRLWSLGTLRLAARLAGLSAPRHVPEAALLIMHPATH